MPFLLYTDAQMTTEAISPIQLDFNGRGKKEIKLYFGSPDPDERLVPKTDDQIMLTATSRLKKWEAEHTYHTGDIVEPTIANGYMYQCLDNGQSGSNEPAWTTKPGSKCSSGGLIFINLGEKFQPADVRIASSAAGLDNAGSVLELGAQLRGGSALPVFIRVTNSSNTVRSDRTDPCISIRLNATTTETNA